jgi:hypothetical protein
MSANCNSSPENNFCVCESNPDYIQYNANGLDNGQGAGNRCCNVTLFTPDILHRLPSSIVGTTEIGSNSKFLYFFTLLEFAPCDYTSYFGGKTQGTTDADTFLAENYPELNTYADRQRQIYNNFYLYRADFYPSSITTNDDLIPVINGNTISTPEDTMPLVFNYYDGVHSESQYLFIVWPVNKELPQLPFKYKFFYFYDINDNDCRTNYCTTLYSPSRGISFSNVGPGNNGAILGNGIVTNLGVTIAVVVLLLLTIVIFSALLIWDAYKYKKKPIQETVFTKAKKREKMSGI